MQTQPKYIVYISNNVTFGGGIFDAQLVESADVELTDMEGWLYLYN